MTKPAIRPILAELNQTLENKKKIIIMNIKNTKINNTKLIQHIIIISPDEETKSNPRNHKHYQKDKNKEDIALWKYTTILN